MWGSPCRKLLFCEKCLPLVCMILEDIYKIINHSNVGALKSFTAGLNYLYDFMGSGAYFIFLMSCCLFIFLCIYFFWTMKRKTTSKCKPERMKDFAPQEILWNEFKDCYWDKKAWMKWDNEGTMYSGKQSGSEGAFSDTALNWHYCNSRMHCVDSVYSKSQ